MTNDNVRVAVVTGASRGIGASIAERLGQDGYTVGIHYGSGRAAAERTAALVTATGAGAFVFQADLSQPGVGASFWAAADAAALAAGIDLSSVHVLVNNAGIALNGSIGELAEADLDRQYAINIRAPFYIVQHGLQRLVEGGRVITTSSTVTRIAYPNSIGYCMTKGAIDVFTFTLAADLGARGITVNAVAPGVVDTDMNADWLRDTPEALDAVAQSAALGRVAVPQDISNIVSFLASTDAGWVTGQTIDASGGAHL